MACLIVFCQLSAESAVMSGTSSGVEWVETTEEVVVTEERLTPESHTSGAGITKALGILVLWFDI